MKKIKKASIVSIIVILLIAFLSSFSPFPVPVEEASASPGWYDDPGEDPWLYRKRITIDSTKVDSDLTDFPVLISTIDTDLRDKAQTDGDDILFTKADEVTKINHEIEKYDSSTGELVAWVQTDLSESADTVLYMYYGNSGAANQENATSVWDDGYSGVWHCNDGTNTDLTDSTANSNTLLEMGTPADRTGKIGHAVDLDGTNDYYVISAALAADFEVDDGEWMILMWANLDGGTTGNRSSVIKGTGGAGMHMYHMRSYREKLGSYYFEVTIDDDVHGDKMIQELTAVNDGAWHLLSISRKNDYPASNDQLRCSVDITNWWTTDIGANYGDIDQTDETNGKFVIGSHQAAPAEAWKGGLDEIWFIKGDGRSEEWLTTVYNNQDDPSAFLGFGSEELPPSGCGDHNVQGWAWSENIGWISFSCENTNNIGDGTDYGVDIDEVNGNFSGYAWSRGTDDDPGGIGWIDFAPAGPYPDTFSDDYSACLDLPGVDIEACDGVGDGTVSGWARACAVFLDPDTCSGSLDPNRGEWDGWIHLRNDAIPNSYGVYASTVDGYSEFYNWAWGGDDASSTAVIGWISFNCDNPESGDCLTSDYQVTTTITFVAGNTAPDAAFNCNSSLCYNDNCIGYANTPSHDQCNCVMENNSTDTDPGDILTSTWYADSEIKDSCTGEPSSCNFTPQYPDISVPDYESKKAYNIILEVTDGEATDTSPILSYEHRRGAYAGFRCSLDGSNWDTVCEDFTVEPGTAMYFKDNLWQDPAYGIYPNDSSYPSCCENTINSRIWKLDDVVFKEDSSEASTTLKNFPATIELTIRDNNPHGYDGGRTASVSHAIGGKPSVPIWREVLP